MTAIQIITKERQNNYERHLIIGFDTKVLQSLISSLILITLNNRIYVLLDLLFYYKHPLITFILCRF